MFELPEAKRVRRDEILSPPSSSTPSSPERRPEDDQKAHALLGKLLGFDTFTADIPPDTTATTKDQDNGDATLASGGDRGAQEEDEEQEFDFRLFSAPAPTTTARPTTESIVEDGGAKPKTQRLRIRVRSPPPGDMQPGEGRLVVPFRGWQYYVTKPELMKLPPDEHQDEAENLRRREYEEVAVTGPQLLQWARTMKTSGCHLPWRVIHLKPSSVRTPDSPSQPMVLVTTRDTSQGKKKSKPGKKRRIILRKRAEKTTALAGMTDAEKRNKKNRERKVKRRQKEREKKAALALATGNTANESSSLSAEENSGSE